VCGGHGSYRMIGRLIDEALDEHADLLDRREHPRDRRGDIEQEVKVMYARGEINANTYYRLLEMAQNGQLSWDDLGRVRQGARVEEPVPKPAPRQRSVEIVNSLNQLYTHRTRLDLPDEATARAYLGTKQEALERAQTLQERVDGLRQNLGRIETLREELATREAELKALESGQQLAELEAGIREDLLRHE
jgi:hypothetical protein